MEEKSSLAQATVKAPDLAAETNLTLNELLRVMDVARELRDSRETAEKVLARDTVRDQLREKLMRTARLSGDRVTEAEVDAAIDTYFADRHRYKDPDFSFQVFLAHCWVRRNMLLGIVVASLITLASIWGLFLSPLAPFSPTRNIQRAVAAAEAESSRLVDQIRAAAIDPTIVAQAERLAAEISAAGNEDPTTAIAATETLRSLHQQLLTSYTLRIARDKDGASLITRSYHDDSGDIVSGHFVLVEAVDAQGTVLPQRIRNMETGHEETVAQWAERIPPEVYERLKQDKLADQILNESDFGMKERGRMDVQITMPDSSGTPIERSIQITNW